jgi:hypothetical protein
VDTDDMPLMQGLIERGTGGNLTTLHPVLSPILWTSIATGKRPLKHGIHGFADPDPKRMEHLDSHILGGSPAARAKAEEHTRANQQNGRTSSRSSSWSGICRSPRASARAPPRSRYRERIRQRRLGELGKLRPLQSILLG